MNRPPQRDAPSAPPSASESSRLRPVSNARAQPVDEDAWGRQPSSWPVAHPTASQLRASPTDRDAAQVARHAAVQAGQAAEVGRPAAVRAVQAAEEEGRFPRASLTQLRPIGRFGRYELLGRLACGGMAEIFLARELASTTSRAGRYVVIKRILPHVAEDTHFVRMFVDEARLAMQLSHPHICHVYAFGEEQGSYYLAMEWINGMPLAKVHRRARDRGGIPIPIALKVIAQVAEALDHAHRACDANGEPLGIVHRDVSPQNIMIAFDGPVKLLDFGVAKAASHETRTEAGIVKGKFAYMSPQQCLGEPIDARADVFALGICLYEILAGRNPFKRQTEFDTMRAIVYESLPPISDVLAERESRPEIVQAIEAVVERALAKSCEERFQSAAEMQMALEHVLARMGEVVTANRIGELMHELFEAEIKAGPQLDTRARLRPVAGLSSSTSDHSAPAAPPSPNATQKVPAAGSDVPTAVVGPRLRKRRISLGWALVAAALGILGTTAVVAPWFASRDGDARDGHADGPSEVASSPLPASAPIPSPVATTGSLYIESTPTGATIELGERGVLGTTPMDIALLEPGRWRVRLTREGYEPWERWMEIRPGDRAHLVATLSAAPTVPERVRAGTLPPRPHGGRDPETARSSSAPSSSPPASPSLAGSSPASRQPSGAMGQLSINSRPWSKVYIGSRLLGITPIGNVEVEAGTVRLRLVDRDGIEHVRTLMVPAGEHVREFFDLRADTEGAPVGE